MSKFVRLKPYNPRRGLVTRRHGIGEMFFVGGLRPNWYEVSDAMAEKLAKKRQFHDDPDSKPLFDVMDKEEQERVAAEEQNQVLAQLGAVGQTVAMPPDFREPRTVDMTKKEPAPAPAPAASFPPPPMASSTIADGRAAAIPQVRSTRTTQVRGAELESAGAVTMSDLQGGENEAGEG